MLAVVMPTSAVEEVYFEVINSDALKEVIGWANTDDNRTEKHYTIAIVGDKSTYPTHISISSPLEITGNVTLTPSLKAINGEDMNPTTPVTLKCEDSYHDKYLFTIKSSGSLTICNNATSHNQINIGIDGNDRRTKSLVCVEEMGKFTLDGTLYGNTADKGGAVYVDGGDFYMKGGVIHENTAIEGGGVYINSGHFAMAGGNIRKNKATDGGSVYLNGGSFSMSNGFIEENNEGIEKGGGVYVNGGSFELIGGDIKNNKATDGGGVYINEGLVKLTTSDKYPNRNPTIYSNQAEYGGGVYLNNGYFTIEKGVIRDNTATKYGGGIYINRIFTNSDEEPKMMGGTLSGNKAEKGGGVYINQSTFIMTTIGGGDEGEATTSGTIQGNTAAKFGSAVYAAADTTFTMEAGEITGNKAENAGSAVYIEDGTFNMKNGKITGNKAELWGGVYVNGKMTLQEGSAAQIAENEGGNLMLHGDTTITIEGLLNENTRIGIAHSEANTEERVLVAHGKERDVPNYIAGYVEMLFFSDSSDYRIDEDGRAVFIVYDPPEPESKGSSIWITPVGGSYALYTGVLTNGGTVNFPEGTPVKKITMPKEFAGDVQVSTQKDTSVPQPTTGTVYTQFDVSTTSPIPIGTTAKIGISIPAADIPAGQGISALHYTGADSGWIKEPATATKNGDTVNLEITVTGLSPFAIVFTEDGIKPTENTDLAPPLDHQPITATAAESTVPIIGIILGLLCCAALRRT